jgi:hypothetical protein
MPLSSQCLAMGHGEPMGSGKGLARAVPARAAFGLTFRDEAGCRQTAALPDCFTAGFERAMPVRSFPVVKQNRNYPGLWWSVTTGRHVGFESWVERDVAMMLDFDREVTGYSSQPFWLCWHDGQRDRRHAPDYFARLADGGGVVVDVRPDDQVDAAAAEVFAVTAEACLEAGWEFRRTGGPPAVLAANVRWLAGYRHPRCCHPDIAAALAEAFSEPAPLMTGAAAAGDPVAVLPVLYHLLWRQVLTADLAGAVLGPGSPVLAAEGAS